MTGKRTPRILIVGAGGIGGLTFDLVVPALEKVGQKCSITIMDGDTVEESNLGHQRFLASDVGSFKTTALVKKYELFKNVYCVSDTDNLRVKEQLQDFDYIIIGVDRPHPRRLVHATNVPWIDLRSTGDGHVYFTNNSDPALVAMMTPLTMNLQVVKLQEQSQQVTSSLATSMPLQQLQHGSWDS